MHHVSYSVILLGDKSKTLHKIKNNLFALSGLSNV